MIRKQRKETPVRKRYIEEKPNDNETKKGNICQKKIHCGKS